MMFLFTMVQATSGLQNSEFGESASKVNVTPDLDYGEVLCTKPYSNLHSRNTFSGGCACLEIHPCLVVYQNYNSGTGEPQKCYVIEYQIETLMNAYQGKGYQIMGGEPQVGSQTYCNFKGDNGGWTGLLTIEYPACSPDAPSSTNRPACWQSNCNNIALNAVPNKEIGVGKSVTCTFKSGFSAGGGACGASVGASFSNSISINYHAVCIDPVELNKNCLYYKTSDNLGETTSSQITTFTTYVGTAFPISNEWTHIYVVEDLHFVTCGLNDRRYGGETLTVGGGFNVDA
ncbi:MAG: hypothetical protein B2I18_05875 [Cuniculiplasma sp. C_DKE]|jgi:hypothetical protein|uniref:Uncharacterized protein n=2 Tax=Cuniculiplasma divulgatum TaxID=1673428 RepID=A0A1N5TEB5_9ARCH|nr:MAG: hypothetical protein B2I18_05875 [Cuniculiplasma sp. C_DKE]SIM46496.1 hypothetical protein CSP5_0540 [Cuniculiplasma divulgatum]SJK84392.1 hypothetical protein CPM_0512 [Cuniculiplasma divulgatum]